jgi:hypothetical protein
VIPWVRKAVFAPREGTPLGQLSLVAWGTFVLQILFDGVLHVSEHPHYYNSTWIVFVMFAWLALDAVPRWLGAQSVVGKLVLPVYAMSLLVTTLVVAYEIVRNGGSRGDHYSALLSNQMEVAKEIAQYSDASPIELKVPYWVTRPDAPAVTFKLAPKAAGVLPTRRIVVQYRDAFPDDARIIVKTYPLDSTAATQPTTTASDIDPLKHE